MNRTTRSWWFFKFIWIYYVRFFTRGRFLTFSNQDLLLLQLLKPIAHRWSIYLYVQILIISYIYTYIPNYWQCLLTQLDESISPPTKQQSNQPNHHSLRTCFPTRSFVFWQVPSPVERAEAPGNGRVGRFGQSAKVLSFYCTYYIYIY